MVEKLVKGEVRTEGWKQGILSLAMCEQVWPVFGSDGIRVVVDKDSSLSRRLSRDGAREVVLPSL